MLGEPNHQLVWQLSGGASNVDADLSLGGAHSNITIRTSEYTLATGAAAGAVRLTVPTVTTSHFPGAIHFRDGNCGGFFTIITAISPGSPGTIDILDPLPFSCSPGDLLDIYATATLRQPFQETTALESAEGTTQSIGIYLSNISGSTVSNLRLWIEDYNPGHTIHEIAVGNDTSHVLNTKATLYAEPDLSGMMSGGGSAKFGRPRSYGEGYPNVNISVPKTCPIWLKRIVPANALRLSWQTVAIVAGNGVVEVRLILHWNTVGFTPVVVVDHAPSLYLRGGTRFKARVSAQETGLQVPGAPVSFSLVSGPGTFYPPAAPSETDEDGNCFARYSSPEDVGEIGQNVTVEASV